MTDDEPISENRLTITNDVPRYFIQNQCNAAAPLVLNGSLFAGCALQQGHDGMHELTVRWQ